MLGMIGTWIGACALQSVFVACYVGNAGSFPKPLRPEEEEYYIERMLAGDAEAKNILIEHNLRLVAHVIKKYVPFGGRDSEDLLSIGTIGLMKGIASYNNQRKTKLATYAAKCIENALLPLRKQSVLQADNKRFAVPGEGTDGFTQKFALQGDGERGEKSGSGLWQ